MMLHFQPGRLAMRACLAGIGIWMLVGQFGCSTAHVTTSSNAGRSARLLHTLGNISDTAGARKKADRHLLRYIPPTNPARLAVLMRVVAGYGQSPKMKIYAMNQLMAADQPLAVGVLARQIPRFHHWRVLIHACALARAADDTELLDPLILSLDRPARRFPLVQRPEADAIRALAHNRLRHCLAEKLLHSQILVVRMAALYRLHRLLTRGEFSTLLLTHRHHHDPMLAALCWYGRIFDYIPRSPDQVVWVQELCNGPYSALARSAEHHLRLLPANPVQKLMPMLHDQNKHTPAYAAASVADSQPGPIAHRNNLSCTCMPQGIPPRLIGLLATLTAPHAYAPPEILREKIQRFYAAYRHIRRPGPYPGSPDNPDPSLAANYGRLSYCDLLVLQTLYAALGHQYFRVEVTQLGHQSRGNKKSEEGGLIQFSKHRRRRSSGQTPTLRLKLYASFKQINEGVYVTGPGLLLTTPTGLAQFVFHFQKSDNRRYTGPAPGDLRYVRTTRCVVVIFTSISRHTFDTTADFPDGAVIDMGIVNKSRRTPGKSN